MLTVSQVASKYNISNRQVHDLVNHGYLSVAQVYRNKKNGVTYLFAENEIDHLDIHSLLAEIRDKKNSGRNSRNNYPSEFKKVLKVMNYYDRFMDNISDYPEKELLKICFYLFHLNHYAKKYSEMSNELYSLKNRVIRKMYSENTSAIQAVYLTGPDRQKVWLCEECKDNARSAGMSYPAYVKKEYYCPKCFLQAVEKEYYSLVEFKVNTADYHFSFHLPLAVVCRWMENLDRLPQSIRETGRYDDKMYLYGRPVSRIEEKIFPVAMVKQILTDYVNSH